MTLPDPTKWPVGKVGYTAIVGRPNVGKSTLLNQFLGAHLVAVSALPQTTRRHWRGILSDQRSQIIFVDTPGAHVGKTRLDEAMLQAVSLSLQDADVVLCLADPTRVHGDEDEWVASRVAEAGKPAILVINKRDAASGEQLGATREFFGERLDDRIVAVCEISALTGEGLEMLLGEIRERLPQGPFFYPPDQAMDALEREIGAEIIREAALHHLKEEVPHALAVEILAWDERPNRTFIRANLFVERESQKGIVVGKGGQMIGRIRQQAINQLRQWLEQRVSLNLHVKVAKDWRNRDAFLKEHGLMDA